MSGPPWPFDAWALPSGIEPVGIDEATVRRSQEGSGASIRHPRPTAEWIRRVCARLGEEAEALQRREVPSIVAAIGAVADRLLDPNDELRRSALGAITTCSGLSPEMSMAVLDGMAADWRVPRLTELVRRELALETEEDDREALPRGGGVIVQIVAGSVPGVSVTALVRSLLVGRPTLLKPGLGDAALPVVFVGALRESDPELADSVAVVYWPGGHGDVEAVALDCASAAVVYGSDSTVESLKDLARSDRPFVSYGHRISLGIVGTPALEPARLEETLRDIALAVAMFDARGCVTPQRLFVEEGGSIPPSEFARRLGAVLDELEVRLPSGALDAAEASALHQLRGTAELLAAAHPEVYFRHGGSRPWSILHAPPEISVGGQVGRFVRVEGVASLTDVPARIAPFQSHLQSLGTAGVGEGDRETLAQVRRMGVTRIVAFDGLPFPPPWWLHDGYSPLRPLMEGFDPRRG